MAKALVCYYSRTGNTQHMAEAIAEGINQAGGTDAEIRRITELSAEDLKGYDAIIMGSPTYYGTMAAELKQLLDESVAFHGQLDGKVGGAFSSSANIAGGNETTIMDILKAMLIHGMVVQGTPKGDHYGPVAIGDLDDRSRTQCRDYGRLVAKLATKLHG